VSCSIITRSLLPPPCPVCRAVRLR
jgi:hypothetical protein